MMIKFILSFLGNLFLVLSIGILMFTYVPIIYSELEYRFDKKEIENSNIKVEVVKKEAEADSENIIPVVPVDDNFSVIIPKIDINVPVVENVTTVNKKEYMDALKNGAAHAKGTALPGEAGNMFVFAHSSINFWQLGKYATAFNLLHNLEDGDTVTFYYNDNPYIYRVFEKKVINGWDTSPYVDEYDEPIVTLVTCTPPGSTINRLVVKAKLVNGIAQK